MRKNFANIGLLTALSLLGCQSYEMRRQERIRELQADQRVTPPTIPVASSRPSTAASPVAPSQSPVSASPDAPTVQWRGIPPVGLPTLALNEPGAVAPPAPSAPANTVILDENTEQAEPPPPAAADKLPQLYRKAVERYAGMDSYIARLRRIEEVNGKVRPEELALFKFRKEPWSIYFKWLGQEGKGREATYVKGRYDNKLYTLLAAGDVPLMPAGKVMALDPYGFLVRANSRHPITEAGIGALIDRFGTLVKDMPTTISYQGVARKPEYPQPLNEVLQAIPPGLDQHLPKGGSRQWYFDTQSGLPVMIMTWDPNRRLVELYAYDQIMHPVKLDDNDFNPDVLWKKTESPQVQPNERP